ncbi:arrestin-C [Ictidomys tridecemlineatus]|uniref:Arrestin-C n=1 Tax=Ictidomys tridecemlineatus TaxID=43179 RepID=ARRC_ICTTR|nr:arrestin-C [Ictidomys tridecemlineatus]Q5DRQ4.1 RecName: Full=Arrestin-C; AltName: Full=Cone arrestin; Short=cArr; AltName: Full=Retinal cone arrestin-3 [Ictidomys tridecemlineatus]AAS89816.1 arrestin 3 [Ictidomys tridecemlineatus]
MASSSKVFKKTSSNGKLSIYLGKRDFMDHVDTVEPIDGVVLVDPEYLKGRKMFVILTCAFRYGRDDLDVIGLTFRKDLYVLTQQVVPAESNSPQGPLTVLQERLLHKLGENAYPFTLQMVANLPCSVTLQPGPEDSGKACGVDFEVKSFCAENLEEKVSKRDSVRLVVRKVQFAPMEPGPGPWAQTIRRFLLSVQPLQLQAWMDKEVHYHGEPISVNVSINNSTSKVIKKIKISVDQITDVVLYSLDKYTKTVFIQEFTETIAANSSFTQSFSVTPLLSANCRRQGLALDGKLKHEDTNLASSTIVRPGMNKELLGILVSYKVRVNLMVSCGGILGDLTASDVGVELPLTLIHPKPSQETTSSEDIVIEEFARQEDGGEEKQKALAEEGDEGS